MEKKLRKSHVQHDLIFIKICTDVCVSTNMHISDYKFT